MLFLIVTISTLPNSLASFSPQHHGNHKLGIVPNKESYDKIQYPHFDITEFGDYRKNDIPPKIIYETKKTIIKVPKPYIVKIPHIVPYPVIEKVPVHVVNREIVKVPEAVPYPLLQTVKIPIEVPKPYPVAITEFKVIPLEGGGQSYGSELPASDSDQSLYPYNNGDLGPEQNGKLNEAINHQENVYDPNQHSSDERPVYEDQKED